MCGVAWAELAAQVTTLLLHPGALGIATIDGEVNNQCHAFARLLLQTTGVVHISQDDITALRKAIPKLFEDVENDVHAYYSHERGLCERSVRWQCLAVQTVYFPDDNRSIRIWEDDKDSYETLAEDGESPC